MSTTVTKRISSAASGGKTARVSEYPRGTVFTNPMHNLFLLEGDESGYLLLEGDMQDVESDALKLEGDFAALAGTTTTKRVPEAVT